MNHILKIGIEQCEDGKRGCSARSPTPAAIVTKQCNLGESDIDNARAGKKRRITLPMSPTTLVPPPNKPFRFLDLPGEIRNRIYHYTTLHRRQALLVHLPRRATLRRRQKPRPSSRSWVGLTQVCSQIRHEYRPIYLLSQEVGLDLTNTQEYLDTFYHASLGLPEDRVGNVTIAVGDVVQEAEKVEKGINIRPLLDMWANSHRIEAGFGRYMRVSYVPEVDGEAKDLYRLFGRQVLENRKCSVMNRMWRKVLREGQLAAVRIHRKPKDGTDPFLHILFKPEFGPEWMRGDGRGVPESWLEQFGFDQMEHFDVKVGVLPVAS
ncbi:uncharacterized protein BDR25DRAFT_382647 [Lindgomyces ingoldianus]|uniref:Uncharacterized protein n=1 Tax=Lindgomyces ingoldianus TaxID=673940 RepID=A0ACB6R8D9_9PLEO|nr:uncharacterized protein BDR25DRAFT_382647 [Lindgomyces ingoldianus]KAF2475578.1 hypothetical protein BDR25DRAFT_382647 [Lindgomyces ingoldianus]